MPCRNGLVVSAAGYETPVVSSDVTAAQLTAEEARVVGALAEKQLTTPQYYPLTQNALVSACNQSNNRDPVVSYDVDTVEATVTSLREKGFARIVHPGSGSRVTKYRQVLDEALGLDQRELALICVLLLRGPQTLNELRSRTERMADFDGVAAVQHDLDRLAEREPPLVVRLGRRPGQREERFATTLAAIEVQHDDARLAQPAQGPRTAAPAHARPALPHQPRIAPLSPAEATDGQRQLLEAVGAMGAANLFGTFAHHEELFRRWLGFGGALLNGTLPARVRELAILRTAYLVGAGYEWGHHVRIVEDRAVLDEDEVSRVAAGPGAGWSGLDRAVLQACDDIHQFGLIADASWQELAASLDEAGMIELTVVIAHYRLLGTVIATLGVQAEAGLAPLPD